ncbi:MAG: glycosyl hydrolase, partial [Verrucomicrobia bacterium]|nr:glycosyl hydrolase [Verrucomicrobiota bacterium]
MKQPRLSRSYHIAKLHTIILTAALIVVSSAATGVAGVTSPWPPATSQNKPWAYWHWMAGAVDETNLVRELHRYADAGLGGMHIIPIYGAKGWESHYIPYLSPRWMDVLGTTVTEARKIGMGIDMTTGTGWNFGGPTITPELSCLRLDKKFIAVPAGQKPAPLSNRADVLTVLAENDTAAT